MHPSTDHIKLNQGGSKGAQVINVVIVQWSLEGKISIKCQIILASDHNILNLEIRNSEQKKYLAPTLLQRTFFKMGKKELKFINEYLKDWKTFTAINSLGG